VRSGAAGASASRLQGRSMPAIAARPRPADAGRRDRQSRARRWADALAPAAPTPHRELLLALCAGAVGMLLSFC